MAPVSTTDTPKRKRKTKDLPEGLSELTEVNFRKLMMFRLEPDPHETGEHMVAYKWKSQIDGNEDDESTQFELEKNLTLDQLRRLCRNVGCPFINKCNKFQCRKALWILANHQNQREKDGERISTASERASNNIIRLTNVIFSSNFVNSLLKLNDIKTRTDHESGGLPSDFWAEVADVLNGASEDDDSAQQIVLSLEDPYYDEIFLIDLDEFDNMTSAAIRKKFNMLMKVRRVMKRNMTTSGEHDNNPYNFVETAMKKAGSTGLTIIGCYYFFVRCEATDGVDSSFSDTMDPTLMGSTADSALDVDSSVLTSSISTSGGGMMVDKKRAYAAMVDMTGVGNTIAEEMKETNKIAKETVLAMNEKNRLTAEANYTAKITQQIMLAQHLGRQDMLEKILEDSGTSS